MAASSPAGVDTSMMLAHTLLEHPDHARAVAWAKRLMDDGRLLALCPTVLDEFLHVAPDPRRFRHPVAMTTALGIVRTWLRARETVVVFPCEASSRLRIDWMARHRLGRKRIHDTRIASTYHQSGIETILTTDVRDFGVFECFEIINVSAA